MQLSAALASDVRVGVAAVPGGLVRRSAAVLGRLGPLFVRVPDGLALVSRVVAAGGLILARAVRVSRVPLLWKTSLSGNVCISVFRNSMLTHSTSRL